MFHAAPALHARVRLQAYELRQIFSRNQAEIFVAAQWRNVREFAARKEHGDRAQQQMQMLGVRNQRQKCEQRERVRPPQHLHRAALAPVTKNAARYVAISAKISRAISPDSQETSPSHLGWTRNLRDKQAENADRAGDGKDGRKIKVNSPYATCGIEEAKPKIAAQWFSVTSAKAQNAQNTSACATPASGRSRMTFACSSTSQTKSRTRLPMGKR